MNRGSLDSQRYSRHRELLSDRWVEKLSEMAILVVGAGGLGSHVLDILIRLAPVHIEIWDPAVLDEPDLNRQTLYTEADLGRVKVEAARDRLTAVNPDVTVIIRREAVTSESTFTVAPEICFDCLDSFTARADLECALRRMKAVPPIIHGGVGGWFGQVAILREPDVGYSSLYGPDFGLIQTDTKEIVPHVVAAVAALQIGEFLRYLREQSGDGDSIDDGEPATTVLLSYDGLTGVTTQLEVR